VNPSRAEKVGAHGPPDPQEEAMNGTMLSLAGAALALLATGAAAKPQAGKYLIRTADQVEFKDAKGFEGVQTAQLWGDLSKDGDWGALFKFKAGTDAGWHRHTSRIHLVMISGTLSIEPEGGQPTELRAGSYALDPGKLRHRTMCVQGEDCVFVLHMTKKFDFLPDKAGKAAGKPAGAAEGAEKKGSGGAMK
jgi:quercetin dioxygenase-like cupin family protein